MKPPVLTSVELHDHRRQPVAAELNLEARLEQICRAENGWSRYRIWLKWQAWLLGRPIENSHWNWQDKFDTLGDQSHRFAMVTLQSHTQGMMAVIKRPRPSRNQAGGVLYLDYLEVAPWNQNKLPFTRRYRGVGRALFHAAVAINREIGCGGRIALHSLPQALAFYQKMGMVVLFQDASYQGLPYLEYNPTGRMLSEELS